jgi:hypothetical protein
MFDATRLTCAALALAASLNLCSAQFAAAQTSPSVSQLPPAAPQPLPAGDTPANPGPLAKDLPSDLHSKSIRQVERKVADWQLARLGTDPLPRTWDFGTLALGLVAASRTLGDSKLSDPVADAGAHYGWRIEHTLTPARDYAFAQALIDVCRGNAKTLAAIRLRLDGDLSDPFDPDHALWTSAAELFFEPAAATELADITSDPTYNAFTNREWHRTEKLLYDRDLHLFAASQPQLSRREKNGKHFFEARANGMALAGLIRVIASLPSDDPLRPLYVDRLREMASALAAAQGADGLWRPGLVDPASYPEPAIAGSSFIVYALAWGITHHHLDARIYLPVVERAWAGLVGHIYQDGRLGSIEPITDETGLYPPGSSWNYGVGAFLLASGEVDALSQRRHW